MLAKWVSDHRATLEIIRLVSGAFSLLFGGAWLGGIEALRRRGGFYSALLAAIAAGVVLAITQYSFDASVRFLYTRALSAALMLSVNPYLLAGFQGIYLGFLPILLFPINQNADRLFDSVITITRPVARSLLFLVSVFISTRVVSVRPGFLHDLLSGLLPILQNALLTMGVVIIAGLALLGGIALVAFVSGTNARWWLKLPTIILAATAVIACGIAILLLGVIPQVILIGYLWTSLRWRLILYLLALIGEVGLLLGLRRLTARLSPRALSIIFAIPAAVAALVHFVLTNRDLLARLFP